MISTLKQKSFLHGVLPAILLSVSVGQIYAFTLFSSAISEKIGSSLSLVQFSFSLGIFFLGMGAAFFGRIVENRIKLASIIGSILFLSGLLTTHLSIVHRSLALLYLGYGLLLGLGTGTIYITPVKTLMMWFPRVKAIAAALPIIGFGLGSSWCTVLHDGLLNRYTTDQMFLPLTLIYMVPMICGCIFLRKPTQEENTILCDCAHPEQIKVDRVPYKQLLTDGYFWRCWTFMLINISAGLCLIPLAKQMMQGVNYSACMISTILIAMGLMNGTGRFAFACVTQCLRDRVNILAVIIIISAWMSVFGLVPALLCITLIAIPACYGAGFSCIPAIIHDHYGIKNVSTIHGAVLSAWGFAGLIGNQLAILSMKCINPQFGPIILILVLHVLNFYNFVKLRNIGKANIAQ